MDQKYANLEGIMSRGTNIGKPKDHQTNTLVNKMNMNMLICGETKLPHSGGGVD
jgi:hypothetical protein